MTKPPPFKPPSLAQHFEAPDDFRGSFGWLCGYSADVGFLDDAADRFTRQMHAWRGRQGRIALALMLDPGNPQITPKEVPGVMHLPMKGVSPCRLLHAKFAILGFRRISDSRQWRLRLIVSTGNWTRETLEQTLDLAWRVDLCSQDLTSQDSLVAQACADLSAAWSLLDWLRERFDFRVLSARVPGRQDSEPESITVERWIAKVIKLGKGIAPRVFDNRGSSLLTQLPDLVRKHASQSTRNYLGMGSGFYESSGSSNTIPSVLKSIFDTLQQAELLTRRPKIDVFVNPKGCQAVANSVPSFNNAGWMVREAGQPEWLKPALRSLHAKFIFSANRRKKSNLCNSAWLYLGSGNLTAPGFTNRMHSQNGNLELGVVIAPESIHWCDGPPESVLANLLPMQWEEKPLNQDPGALMAGTDMPDPEVRYSAPPVAYFFWIVDQDITWLQNSGEIAESFELLDDAGNVCHRDPVNGFPWPHQRPLQVQLRWFLGGQERRAWVPVIDEYGRIAGTIFPRIDIEEAWSQLANFPMPPDEEELLADGDPEPNDDAARDNSRTSFAARYPIRQMMQLIENIAAKQTSVCKADWIAWCTRLEQCLIQASGSEVIGEFLNLQLHPLSPLWHSPFRPAFASTGESAEGLRYESVLARVAIAWNVADLSKFGDQQ